MIKSGVIALVTAAVIVAAGFLYWRFFIPWPYTGEVAAILLTGLLAVIVAVWAIYSQRAIARRQCTLEHTARLEADGDLIRMRRTFRELAKKTGGMEALAAPGQEETVEFQAVTTRLNEFELISIGIQRGIIDFELYKRWFRSGTIRAWYDAEPFIKALRKRHNNQMLFHEFHVMVEWFEKNDRPARSRWW